jgi:3-hydroxyisobutyrate dehydrogenase-like beta-hydroxyacid dehydrogenase
MTDIRQVGFIGIGRMGRGMVLNLARAGFGVAAWNRSAIDRGELADAGVRFVDTPAQAARSGLVVSMVADDAALAKPACSPDCPPAACMCR